MAARCEVTVPMHMLFRLKDAAAGVREPHLSAVPVAPRDRLQVGPTAGGEWRLGRGRSGLLVTSSPGCTCDGGGIAASKGLSDGSHT